MVRKTHVKANARKVETGGEHGTPTNAEKAIPWTPDEVANLFLLAYSKLPLTQSNVQAICEKLGTDRTPLAIKRRIEKLESQIVSMIKKA